MFKERIVLYSATAAVVLLTLYIRAGLKLFCNNSRVLNQNVAMIIFSMVYIDMLFVRMCFFYIKLKKSLKNKHNVIISHFFFYVLNFMVFLRGSI